MAQLNLKPSAPAPARSRPILSSSLLKPWVFKYSPSPDGNDLNLLILLHGLGTPSSPSILPVRRLIRHAGDTKQSFADLGKKLNLPSTATLALQAPDSCVSMPRP